MAPTIQKATDAGRAASARMETTIPTSRASRQLSGEIWSKTRGFRGGEVTDIAGMADMGTLDCGDYSERRPGQGGNHPRVPAVARAAGHPERRLEGPAAVVTLLDQT